MRFDQSWKDRVFEDWRPLPQSLIAARGSLKTVAQAMQATAKQTSPDWESRFDLAWVRVPWFALAVECIECGRSRVAYEDETA